MQTDEKALPHNLEAEKKILGSMMRDIEAVYRAQEILDESAFYQPSHEKIFHAIIDLTQQHAPIDLTAIADIFERKGELNAIGGPYYLVELFQSVVSSANIEYHCKIVKERSQRRQLIHLSRETELSAFEDFSIDELTPKFQQKFLDIISPNHNGGLLGIDSLIENFQERVDLRHQKALAGKATLKDIPIGYIDLDRMIGGFNLGELIILAARPAEGKTSLALNIAEQIGKKQPVAFFSLEMSRDQLMDRLIYGIAKIPSKPYRNEPVTQEEAEAILKSSQNSKEIKLYIDDSAKTSLDLIESRCKRLGIEKGNLGLVVIDYLQLLTKFIPGRSTNDLVSSLSRGFKLMAKSLKVPILLLSQLSRNIEHRGDNPIPRLSDLRDSGAIEQDADIVIFIHRPSGIEKDRSGEREILIAKNRTGRTGKVSLYFNLEITTFDNFSKENNEPF